MIGYALLALVVCALIGAIVLRAMGQPLRSYLPPIAFGNAGNLGLPLCLFAFGKQGLGLAIGFYLVGSVSQFIAGPLFQGRQPVWRTLAHDAGELRRRARRRPAGHRLHPATLARQHRRAAGRHRHSADDAGPRAIPSAASRCSGCRWPPGIAAGRLGLGLLVGYAITLGFGLTGMERGVVLVQSAMPVAVFNYLLAARYDRHPEDIAGAIVISTLVAFAALPALLLFALPAAPP